MTVKSHFGPGSLCFPKKNLTTFGTSRLQLLKIFYTFSVCQNFFELANKVKFSTQNFRRVPSITQNGHYWGNDRPGNQME